MTGGGSAPGRGRSVSVNDMSRSEFDSAVRWEFGDASGSWIVSSHVLSAYGATARELLDAGREPRDVWEGLCDDFEVPAHRRLGEDR